VEVEVSETEVRAYQLGHYEDALALFRNHVERVPEAMQVLYSLIWLCERVVATVPDDSDMDHFAVQREWNRASSVRRAWFRLRGREPGEYVRCKWCGHFAEYRNPSLPGFANRCTPLSSDVSCPAHLLGFSRWYGGGGRPLLGSG
jgi:hypothetical protein